MNIKNVLFFVPTYFLNWNVVDKEQNIFPTSKHWLTFVISAFMVLTTFILTCGLKYIFKAVQCSLVLGCVFIEDWLIYAIHVNHQDEAAKEVKQKEKKQLAMLQEDDLTQFVIKGSEVDWDKALVSKKLGMISVKRWAHW